MTQGPFDEPLFDAVARRLGCHDQGKSWHRIDLKPLHSTGSTNWALCGPGGVDNDMLVGLPSEFPRFRHVVRESGIHATHLMDRRYTVTRIGRTRTVSAPGHLPETLISGLAGRPLTAFMNIPGADLEEIAFAAVEMILGQPRMFVTLSENRVMA